MATSSLRPDDSVTVGVHTLPVWPPGQKLHNWRKTGVLATRFDDHDLYAEGLKAEALRRADDPALAHHFERSDGVGSAKVFDIDKWDSAAASLIHARALALFRLATADDRVAVDLSWASVYHEGDFCVPHSHPRTVASALYLLDSGDAAREDASGRFYFADPRLAPCCREEEGVMNTPSAPNLEPGAMLLFPGKLVHFVSPYYGSSPRLTMSWNLNPRAKDGAPLPAWVTRPG